MFTLAPADRANSEPVLVATLNSWIASIGGEIPGEFIIWHVGVDAVQHVVVVLGAPAVHRVELRSRLARTSGLTSTPRTRPRHEQDETREIALVYRQPAEVFFGDDARDRCLLRLQDWRGAGHLDHFRDIAKFHEELDFKHVRDLQDHVIADLRLESSGPRLARCRRPDLAERRGIARPRWTEPRVQIPFLGLWPLQSRQEWQLRSDP